MTIHELHAELLNAYRVENLNKISLTLITLYKNQQYSILRKIADIISDSVSIEIQNNGKGFSGFMMLYHPDRANYHISEMNKLAAQNNFDGLLGYSHILKLERIEEIAASLDSFEDIDYAPVYEWDIHVDGFSTIDENKLKKETRYGKKKYSFYDAVKIREYGHTNIDYPFYYLEDFEEFELSSSGIDDLDGIQYCIHARIIDLSDNEIYDLSFLNRLVQIEELNFSANRISYIDSLSNLMKLKSVDLSNNNI
jgi:Leucine-rich repeat (LRR) protein